jgi:hypothetical protein
MGFATKVQLIKRKASEQWYINFPSAVAQAMEFSPSETVEWIVEDKSLLALRRLAPPSSVLKKTPPPSSPTSNASGTTAHAPSGSADSPSARKPSH